MAIGSALLLGYRFTENFDSPYHATSPQDFWHRWHISLSTWLRDYLFIPLGGSRRGPNRTLVNLALTMVLGGLWHGRLDLRHLAPSTGGAHRPPALVAAGGPASRGCARAPLAVGPRALTFHFVCLAGSSPRAVAGGAFEVLGAIASPWSAGPWLSALVLLATGVGVLGTWFPERWREAARARFAALPVTAQGALFGVAVLAIEAAGPTGVAPFIYFQF
jgi:hypothetical protein